MAWISLLRGCCAAVVVATLALPSLSGVFERQVPQRAACRCSNHACCKAVAGPRGSATAACPLARAGLACARPRTANAPGLRAGCGCHQRGDGATLAQQKPALIGGHLAALDFSPEVACRLSARRTSVRNPRFAPDPPPPRAALRLA